MSPSLFKIIATFILAYLIFRIFTAWILPMIARWYINRFRKKFYERNPHARQSGERKKRGDIHITYKSSAEKTSTDDLGEYVDFEEVKEKDKKTE